MKRSYFDRGMRRVFLLGCVLSAVLISGQGYAQAPLQPYLGVFGDIPQNNTDLVELMEDQEPPMDAVKNVRAALLSNPGTPLDQITALPGVFVPLADIGQYMFPPKANPHKTLDDVNEVNSWQGLLAHAGGLPGLFAEVVRLSAGHCGGTDEDGNLIPCSIHPPGHANVLEGVVVFPDYKDPQSYPTDRPKRLFWYLHLNAAGYQVQVDNSKINLSPCNDTTKCCNCPPDASGTPNCDGGCSCYKIGQGAVTTTIVPQLEGYQSFRKFEVIVKDRTPPHIQPIDATATETDGAFPNLFKDPMGPKATTGDHCLIQELKVVDNGGGKIGTWFAFNRRNGPAQPAQWSFDTASDTVKNGDPLSHVFIPDDMYGDMEYSIFAWDNKNNLNPGDSKIDEDLPSTCYGISGESDLGTDGTFRFADESELVARLQGPGPKHVGLAFIDDNDRPNFYVKIISKRDRADPTKQDSYAMVIPPYLPPVITGGLDPSLTKLATMSEGVKYDYGDVFDLANIATAPNMFTFLELKPSGPLSSAAEQKLFDMFTDLTLWSGYPPIDYKKYIAEHFRIESYAESDTNDDGTPRNGDQASFGVRNGWGAAATVFYNEPIIEDVEHELWIWADDNVKFMNYMGQHIPHPYHGIQELNIDFNDPRQNPPLRITKNIAKPPDFWTGPIPVTFREPTTGPGLTPPVPTPATAAACKAHYPSLKVTAKDYKGNTRELTILFEVMDQKAAVRVLEQKQLKQ